jgi:hypothetical protein
MMNRKGNEMDYGMFTEEGNLKVESIVNWHSNNKDVSSPELVIENLRALADYDEMFAEATDTAVREIVLEAVFPELFV